MSLPDPLVRLIEELQRLPGIGAKGAQRLAFHILQDAARARRSPVPTPCATSRSGSPTARCATTSPTPIRARSAASDARDQRLICVVEEPQNVAAVEKTREFKGIYHVLMGALSPLQGVGPDDLKIKGLLARVDGGVTEVILATNPNVEGEATAIYLARLLKPLGVRVTRIAMGVPVGSRSRIRRRGDDAQGDRGAARGLSRVMLPHGLRAAGARSLLDCSAAPRLLLPATGCSASCSAIYGFILGAMIASSVMGVSNTAGDGGRGARRRRWSARVMLRARVLRRHRARRRRARCADRAPRLDASSAPAIRRRWRVIVASIAGAVGAMLLQRYVIIVGTAFGGAWTMIVGAMSAAGQPGGRVAAAAAATSWVLYPLDPAPGQRWVPIAWIVLGLIGAAVQLGCTGGGRGPGESANANR